ncbi:MAG: hypothetical protein ABFC62_10930 [Clostridiaceae bacterium]
MEIRAVDEYNEGGHLIYAENFIGAFVRGKTKEEALGKFKSEIGQYARWLGMEIDDADCTIAVVQEKRSGFRCATQIRTCCSTARSRRFPGRNMISSKRGL